MTDQVLPAPLGKPVLLDGGIDLLRQRDVGRLVGQAFEQLEQLHEGGRNMPLLFRRSLVLLASRLVAVQDWQGAMALLVRLPRDFFTIDLPGLMLADSDFAYRAGQVADCLVEQGLVEPEYRHDPVAEIQPWAKA